MARYTDGDWEFDSNRGDTAADQEFWVRWRELLVAAGWTVVQRSDGAVVHDSGVNGFADWGNAHAWEVYLDPSGAGGRHLVMQRGGSGYEHYGRIWMGKRGADAPSGGTATDAPTGNVEQVFGGASGTYLWSGSTTDGLYRGHMAVRSAPVPGTDVYTFHAFTRQKGGSYDYGFVLAAVQSADDGALGDADSEPWVFFDAPSTTGVHGWFKAGLSGEVFDDTDQLSIANLPTAPTQSPYSGASYAREFEAICTTGGRAQIKGRLLEVKHIATGGELAVHNPTAAGNCWVKLNTSSHLCVRWPPNVIPDET